jgi:hypothetical protein
MIRPIHVVGDVAYVTLTQGKVSIIDAPDVPLVAGRNWCALRYKGGKWYAYCKSIGGRMHKIISPPPDGMLTDHKDGDGLNNRRENLRHASRSQNAANQSVTVRSRTGIKGVQKRSERCWRARIMVDGKELHLGQFDTADEAIVAYNIAARDLFGPFAALSVNPRDHRSTEDAETEIR